VKIVSLLARAGRPMSVGEIVTAVAVGRHYRVNDECVACFPTAADVVMGQSAPARPDRVDETN
jgi:hypothetical protein